MTKTNSFATFLATRKFHQDLRPVCDGSPVVDYPEPVRGFAYNDTLVLPVLDDGRFHLFLQYDEIREDRLSCELDLFYYYGRDDREPLTFFERVEMACFQSDLDAACRYIQDGLGQDDGGVAGMFFSYVDGSDGPNESNWRTADLRTRFKWASDYIRSELCEVEARLTDPDSFAQSIIPGMVERLEARGFYNWSTGGGCVAMALEVGTCQVLVTDNGGAELPSVDSWIIGAYDEDNQELFVCADNDAHGGFDTVLARAIEKAKTADMEQSAKRRGDI